MSRHVRTPMTLVRRSLAIGLTVLFTANAVPQLKAHGSTGGGDAAPGSGGPLASGGVLDKVERVDATGSYRTAVPIAVPPAPGAPAMSLEYDSGSAGGVAGVGWDLSVGWPTLISRDVRFGTPEWKAEGPWIWGASPLVVAQPGCTGTCDYRTVPDQRAEVKISSAKADASLPDGSVLTYEPVRYGTAPYPAAPPGAASDVFGYLLTKVVDRNGYATCFAYQHFGADGRVAAMVGITYGANCTAMEIDLAYDSAASRGYVTPWSMRFGAPASFDNLLTSVTMKANGVEQWRYGLAYESAAATETRRPRLQEVNQSVSPPAVPQKATRTLRRFAYGSRASQFNAPQVLDLGIDATEAPPSLSGGSTRPIRNLNLVSFLTDPIKNVLFGSGQDQLNRAAPPSNATTEQWQLLDLNGDGLLDDLWAKEHGFAPNTWNTYEDLSSINPGNRTPQQQVRINEGVAGTDLHSTVQEIDAHASGLESAYPAGGTPTDWIWVEGRGASRTGMPMSVSTPEVRKSLPAAPPPLCPFDLPLTGGDTRLWPVLPDGTLGGSQGSVGEQINNATGRFFSNGLVDLLLGVLSGIHNGYVPHDVASATLSGWLDRDGDGVPEFVSTPSFIDQFRGACPEEPTPAEDPSAAPETRWFAGTAQPAASGLEVAADATAGPSGPAGLPLDYTVSSGAAQGFGFTLPLGSYINAAAKAAGKGGAGVAQAVAEMTTRAFTPRGSTGLSFTPPALKSTTGLLLDAVAAADTGATAGEFMQSAYAPGMDWLSGLDLTVAAATTRGRTQGRAQTLDMNADGLVDYLLYDSGDFDANGVTGDLLVFVNDGQGGFKPPAPVNADAGTGSDYSVRPNVGALAKEFTGGDAALTAARMTVLPACKAITGPTDPVGLAACGALGVVVLNIAKSAGSAATLANVLLGSSPDALPADRFLVDELPVAEKVLTTQLAAFAADAATAFLSSCAAGCAVHPADGLVEFAQKTLEEIGRADRTVRQLDYRSRINMLSKGFSEVDGGLIGTSADGVTAQTGGLVDLNGDGLPDYVITDDRQRSCAAGQWEVFWATGSAGRANERAFSEAAACWTPPAVPGDLAKRGFNTMPLQADLSRRPPGKMGIPLVDPAIVDAAQQSLVTLTDFNQDGRPDLLVASAFDTGTGSFIDAWDPTDASRTWSVFLNTGLGFESTPLTIAGLGATQQTVRPAWLGTGDDPCRPPAGLGDGLTVPYPSMRSTHTSSHPTDNSLNRDTTCVHTGFGDIDADGNTDVVRRVRFCPGFTATCATERAGLLVWSRAGTGPQDLMVEERYPIEGSRVLVEYRNGPLFQWPDGRPDGQPPRDGHYPAAAVSRPLVASVTVERLMGRSERRTRIGFDYRRPFFDEATRLPAGFAVHTSRPLDPGTGAALPYSVTTEQRSAQRPNGVGGVTHDRLVETRTGAPITETLSSYAERDTTTTGPTKAVISEITDRLEVEYPENLPGGAVLDVGWDGRDPFTDRVAGTTASFPAANAVPPVLDPLAPTGGAAGFVASQPSPVTYTSPHSTGGATSAAVPAVTLETWVAPSGSGDRVIVQQPGAYELSVTAANKVRFQVGGAAVEAPLPQGWVHVAATFSSGTVGLYVNGVAASATAGGAPTASGQLVVGCADNGGAFSRCFHGAVGELRVYPYAWTGAPRVSGEHRELHLAGAARYQLGFPKWVAHYHDLSTAADDVTDEYSYADLSPRYLAGLVHEHRQRGGADVLAMSRVSYDGAGNETERRQYDGLPAPNPTALNVATVTEYSNPGCPGRATATVDPEGHRTATTWDATCTFPVTVTNPLGHESSKAYYDVAGTFPQVPYGYRGLYGQVASSTDANGATTATSYDEWGRPAFELAPLERTPTRFEYHDAACEDAKAAATPCSDLSAVRLASPTRATTITEDDQLYEEHVVHEFGDGQRHVQTSRHGQPDWTIDGLSDYDAQGRVSHAYKARYLSDVAGANGCSAADTWCDGNALRQGVATIDTAYDSRSRVIRTYGPGAVRCASDPSTRDASGALVCDQLQPAGGDVTKFEFDGPGVSRVVNQRGIPTVTRTDDRGLVTAVEERLAATGGPSAVITSSYDRLGRLVASADQAGDTSTFTYDALDRVTATSDPDRGDVHSTYDRRGLLTEETVATGDRAKHVYDELGRPTRSEYYKPVAAGSGPPKKIDFRPRPLLKKPFEWVGTFKDKPHFSPDHLPGKRGSRPPLSKFGAGGLMLGDMDDGVLQVTLPFDVVVTPNIVWADRRGTEVHPIPGTNVFPEGTPVFVNTNGKIRLDAGGTNDARPVPRDGRLEPEAALYPYFDDLVLEPDGIGVGLVGEAPHRQLIVEWRGTRKSAPGEPVHVAAAIYEGTGEIQYQYDAVPASDYGRDGAKPVFGAQNASVDGTKSVTVPVDAGPDQAFHPTAGTVVTTMDDTGGPASLAMQQLSHRAEAAEVIYPIDLTDLEQGAVELRHRWLSRCATMAAGTCDVDRMTVVIRRAGEPGTETDLFSHEQMTSADRLQEADRPTPDQPLRADVPAEFLGTHAELVVRYDPVTRTSADIAVTGLQLQEVKVTGTQAPTAPEEVVLHRYDSHEQPSDVAPSELALDVPFDVPTRIEDRSTTPATPPQATSGAGRATAGASGWGAALQTGDSYTFDVGGRPMARFTVEAWLNPTAAAPTNPETLVEAPGVFALVRQADGRLTCQLLASGATHELTNVTELPAGVWSHVALTFDGASFGCRVNGDPTSDDPAGGGGAVTSYALHGHVASATSVSVAPNSDFDGGVDELRIFSDARSAAVLDDAGRALEAGPPRGDLLDVRFADPSQRGRDSSPMANHATITGGDVIAGAQGAALTFGANTGVVEVPDGPRVRLADQVATESWVRVPAALGGPAHLIGKWQVGVVTPGWRLSLYPGTGQLLWEVRTLVPQPTGPPITAYGAFVTYEQVNDDQWHHLAATYDGARMRVYIDGVPARRTCGPTTDPGEHDILGVAPIELPPRRCTDPPSAPACQRNVRPGDDIDADKEYTDVTCARGSIDNTQPLTAAAANTASMAWPFSGSLDELRVSNYAKRPYEVAASARPAAADTRLLGREVELRNELAPSTLVARERRAFDAAGRPLDVRKQVAGQTGSTPITARAVSDNQGRVGSQEYPTGEVVVTGYDRSGFQSSVIGHGPVQGATLPLIQPYLNGASSTITGRLATASYGNGVQAALTYTDGPAGAGGFGPDLLAEHRLSAPGGTTISRRTYDWDVVGNLDDVNSVSSPGHASMVGQYSYDGLDRLTGFTSTVGGGTPTTASYAYDAIGNLVQKEGATQAYGRANSPAGCGSGTASLPHAVAKRTLGINVTGYCYDAAGRLTQRRPSSGPSRTLDYYARGGLRKVEQGSITNEYAYDGAGVRVSRKDAAGLLVEPFAFYRQLPGGGWEALYSANGQLLARRSGVAPADVSWYHHDHLGGTNFMSDGNGNEDAASHSEYRPFGEYLPSSTPSSARAGGRQYTGKELDRIDRQLAQDGLYYYGARYYDPETGRFTTPDSIVPGPKPQAYNRYSYAYNSPTRYTDPTGHAPKTGPDAIDEAAGSIARAVRDAMGPPPTTVIGPLPPEPRHLDLVEPLKVKARAAFAALFPTEDLLLTKTPLRDFAKGVGVGAGFNLCIGICVGALEVNAGLYVTPPGPNDSHFGDVHLTLGVGGAFLGFTPPAENRISFLDNPAWQNAQPGVGLSAGYGGQLSAFVSQATTTSNYEGYARQLSASAGGYGASLSRNANDQYTLAVSRGRGPGGGITLYNTYTLVSPGLFDVLTPVEKH